ncbi:MAG: zinc ABC transporter substrate-binding protein [Streptosporangiaceae bacterium]|nr:zinc ABC transporter substrate-binding protein [Streptosporangiaceae bacterium]
MRARLLAIAAPAIVALIVGVTACSPASGASGTSGTDGAGGTTATSAGAIVAVGAENQYADVISQVGGKYVSASAIMSNPNSDPHTFEASARVAQAVSSAQLVVQNGLGYDAFMNTIENAVGSSGRKVIDVQKLLNVPDSEPNPHLWYKPGTMVAVANAVAGDLAAIQPAHAAYFRQNATAFVRSLDAWTGAISAFNTKYPYTPVATTEPVADYLLQAIGADDLTPMTFQLNVMNGTDPSAQNVAAERSLFTRHSVKVLVYNQQVTDSLTQSFITLAHANGIPVVGVYETMPAPGYDYQSWMVAEVQALSKAVQHKVSTEHL